jgi:hypothetical protein
VLSEVLDPPLDLGFDWRHPWKLGFDLHLTMFEEFLRSPKTGSTSTGLTIIDHADDYFQVVRAQEHARQHSSGWREIKKIVEIGYSAASHANPMIQLADLVAFTIKKFHEAKLPCSESWPSEAHAFFTQCKDTIWSKVQFKSLSFRKLNVKDKYIQFFKSIRKT